MDQEEEDQTLDQRLTQLTQTQELQLQESRLLLESVNNFKEYFVELGKMVKNLRQAVADNAGSLESIGNRPAPAPAQAAKQDDNLTRELLYGPQRFKVTVRVQNAILSQSKNIPLVWLAQSPKKDSDHDPKEFANSQFKITARSKARFYNFEQINDAIRLFWYVIRESDLSNDAKDGAMQITQAFQEIIAQYNRRPEIILWGWEQLMTKCNLDYIFEKRAIEAKGYKLGADPAVLQKIHSQFSFATVSHTHTDYMDSLDDRFAGKRSDRDRERNSNDPSKTICFSFNNEKPGHQEEKCDRRHVCLQCKGDHPKTRCPEPEKKKQKMP